MKKIKVQNSHMEEFLAMWLIVTVLTNTDKCKYVTLTVALLLKFLVPW